MKNISRINNILSHRIVDEILLRKKIKKYKQFYYTRIFDIFLNTDYDTKEDYIKLYKQSFLTNDKYFIINQINMNNKINCNKVNKEEVSINKDEYINKDKINKDEYIININKDEYINNINKDEDNIINNILTNININRKTLHQIHIDIKRLSSIYKISGTTDISYIYYNILILISHRRFKLGYVQGMADFLVPLIFEYSKEDLSTCENKSYFSYLEIIRKIEFNIINLQGNLILRLREELENIDPFLYSYLLSIRLDFHIFSFRWFNCLFFREFQYSEYLRIFTFILSFRDINKILIYISVGILTVIRQDILKLEYNEIVLMIQDLINRRWKEGDINEILNRANNLYKL